VPSNRNETFFADGLAEGLVTRYNICVGKCGDYAKNDKLCR